MMKIFCGLACFTLTACLSLPVRGASVLYINFAPDTRYSADGHDSRISLDLENGLYGYGHDYGKLLPCQSGSKRCVSFDFMALYELPDDFAVGAEYTEGDYRFSVVRKVDLSLLGLQHSVFRVDVFRDGRRSNSYLIDSRLGVVAIIVQNFDNKEIPESIYFLKGSAGVFANSNTHPSE